MLVDLCTAVIGMRPAARYDVDMVNRGVIGTMMRRPSLWVEGLRASAAVAPGGWWRRPPFLPRPDRAYMDWRLHTAYGDAGSQVQPEDLVSYLQWRKRQRSRG